MRIVYLITSLSNSAGMERVLCTKANYLSDIAGYSITIITKKPVSNGIFYDFSSSINIESLNIEEKSVSRFDKLLRLFTPDPLYEKRLIERIHSLKPDITISMFGEEFGFLHKLKDGSSKIAEFHYSRNYLVHLIEGIPNIRMRRVRLFFAIFFQCRQRKIAEKFDKVVLLTEHDRRLWGNKPNLTVIPNPVSFKISKIASLQNKQIIAVGRLIAQKGFDLLIKAFKLISEENPDWNLLIVGEGQDKDYLLELIYANSLTSRITIGQPEKNIQEFLIESSIFALPSRYEGFGLVLTEAMECGVPSVAFNCECGPSEILNHGQDGFLVENGNIEMFAEKLNILMNDNELRHKMGLTAKQNVRRFYVEPVMDAWKSLFSDVVGERL
jgi:glycosyltransferase involved in cell wall biosynthesis